MSGSRTKDSALILLSATFFIWGLITVVSNSLIPHYKLIFGLDYQTVMLFPLAFFISRIVVSLPVSLLMARIGYKTTLLYCLFWCLLGCVAMAMCVRTEQLFPTLLGIFLMASGISAIQVVSSPYVSLLSTPENSVRRQSVATASNSIGTVLGPMVLSGVIAVAAWFGLKNTGQQISILFGCIALFFAALLIYFRLIDLTDIKPNIRKGFGEGLAKLVRQTEFIQLVVVLTLYIGVEVSFGTFTITYLADHRFGDLGLMQATQLIAGYWSLMFLGRLLFARYGYLVSSARLFVLMCSSAIVVSVIAMLVTHLYVGYLLILVGLFNATLYPIIYAQALKAAGTYTSQAAALLIMCSIGGAILPFGQAMIIDSSGLTLSYLIPAASYLTMIALFLRSIKRASPVPVAKETLASEES